MIKKLRKENTNICTNSFLTNRTEKLMLIIFHVSGHVTLVSIHNYLSLLPILYFLQPQQAPQIGVDSFPDRSVTFVILFGLGCDGFPLTLIAGHDSTRDALKQCFLTCGLQPLWRLNNPFIGVT